MVTQAPTFSPRVWLAEIQERYFEQVREQNRRWLMLRGIDPDNQPTISEKRPLSPEFLAARAAFEQQWNELAEFGEKAGYLGHAHCYDCGGELKITADISHVVSVPNPAFDADKPNPYALPEDATYTFPRSETR
jgi:hypothetical protein